jgi:hypothetical protein
MALPAGPSIVFLKNFIAAFFEPCLNENIQLISVLMDGSRKILQSTVYLYKYCIQVPPITELSTRLLEPNTILVSKP